MSARTLLIGLIVVVLALALAPPLRIASIDKLRPPEPRVVTGLARYAHGSQLAPEEAAELERALAADPSDAGARLELIGFYRRDRRREEAVGHALWLIEHAPESAEPHACSLDDPRDRAAGEAARELWLAHLEQRPDDPTILRNASAYFARRDAERSMTLLQRGEELEPAEPSWPERIGQLHLGASQTGAGEFDRTASLAALAGFERALDKLSARATTPGKPIVEVELRRNAAIAAFRAGEDERAEDHATAALAAADRHATDADAGSSPFGQAVHSANLVLGHVALRGGDVAEAERRLLAAAEAKGSPVLSTSGPRMLLANELLDRGRCDAVLQYFALCKRFWNDTRLEAWASDVEAGRTPDFGANLWY